MVYAGETIQWSKSLADFPATEYTLKYYLTGPASLTLTAAAYNTTDHLVTVSAATSAAYIYGIYAWIAYAEKGAGATLEKYRIGTGFLTIKTAAGKSHAKKMLDAIEAFLEGQTVSDVESYTIGGRSINKMKREELMKWRNTYRAEYQAELANENRINGKSTNNRVLLRPNRYR
jgi:hypothetical protein